ncbi:hypothetical protein FE810_10480 [Thalassotalea litorea]|uniref:Uncharacterized protein n=1 Tax=Thalassotalea litorea TaxID=2020715 RepID=A0A5R9IK80_9GAMM|nr:hypothetical protein [Thalassotalea litorea]TLU64873.1 hypothetical protein FE810_10480 [Thalassotalea litorea]
MQSIPLQHKYLRLFIEGEQGLIFCQQRHSLFRLPPLSIALILGLDSGVGRSECLNQVSRASGLALPEIEPAMDEVWDLYHLASSNSLPRSPQSKSANQPTFTGSLSRSTADITSVASSQSSMQTIHYRDGLYFEVLPFKSATQKKTLSVENQGIAPCSESFVTIDFGSIAFRIECQDSDFREMLLALFDRYIRDDNLIRAPVTVQFQIQSVGIEENNDPQFQKHYRMLSQQRIVAHEITFSELMPTIIERMQILTFQLSAFRFCYHGAALIKDQQLLLLPGKSGVGKSTLTAYLATKGYQVCSDEMIVLDDDFNVLNLPAPLAIKSGAWSVLQAYYPQLAEQPVWQHKDGRKLKYVWPQSMLPNAGKVNSASHWCNFQSADIIAPNYQNERPLQHEQNNEQNNKGNMPDSLSANFSSFSVIDMLNLVVAGGYQVGKELSATDVIDLIGFFETIRRGQLSYSSNEAAFHFLSSNTNGKN